MPLYVVATPIGNLSDVTGRTVETLRTVDLIATEDTRIARRLLSRHGIEARLIPFYRGKEDRAVNGIVPLLERGDDVALISNAGTPCLSDPGYLLVRACHEAGIPVVAVPGPSALAAAISISGIDCTTFTFVGFLPRRRGRRIRQLEAARDAGGATVIYESPRRLATLLVEANEVYGNREAALCREMTKVHEEVRRGTIDELHASVEGAELRGECTLIIAGAGKKRREADSG